MWSLQSPDFTTCRRWPLLRQASSRGRGDRPTCSASQLPERPRFSKWRGVKLGFVPVAPAPIPTRLLAHLGDGETRNASGSQAASSSNVDQSGFVVRLGRGRDVELAPRVVQCEHGVLQKSVAKIAERARGLRPPTPATSASSGSLIRSYSVVAVT